MESNKEIERFSDFKKIISKINSSTLNEWRVEDQWVKIVHTFLSREFNFSFSSINLSQVISETLYSFRKNKDLQKTYFFFENRIISQLYDKEPEILVNYLIYLKTVNSKLFVNIDTDSVNLVKFGGIESEIKDRIGKFIK